MVAVDWRAIVAAKVDTGSIERTQGRGDWLFLSTTEVMQMTLIRTFLHDEDGATAIEYALIASLIAVVIITAVTTVGTKVAGVFTTIAGVL